MDTTYIGDPIYIDPPKLKSIEECSLEEVLELYNKGQLCIVIKDVPKGKSFHLVGSDGIPDFLRLITVDELVDKFPILKKLAEDVTYKITKECINTINDYYNKNYVPIDTLLTEMGFSEEEAKNIKDNL